jgi:hypothetical protein
VLPDFQKYLVQDIFGFLGVAEHARQNAVQEPAVAVVQLSQRGLLAARYGRNQLRVEHFQAYAGRLR